MSSRRHVGSDRRHAVRRDDDVAHLLTELEEGVRANRRELDLQFQRIAHMQAELDTLKKVLARSGRR